MLKLKNWNGAAVKRKFARYRLWFALSLAVFLAAASAEMIWFGADLHASFGADVGFRRSFSGLATMEGILYLITFLAGVTVYAPAWQLLAAGLRGFSAGFVLSSLLPLGGGRDALAFFSAAAYLLTAALWHFAYASFCTAVSLRIFSSHAERGARGEERLFGGTLFYAELFCGSVNLRFLFTYTLFFFASLIGAALLAAGCVLTRIRLW